MEASKFSRDLVVWCYNNLVAKDVIHVSSVASEVGGILSYRWSVSKQGDRVRQFVTYIVEELLDFLHPLLTAGQRRNKRIWEDHPLQL